MNWFLGVFYCVIYFRHWPDLNGKGCNHTKVLWPAANFASVPRMSGLCIHCFIFTFSLLLCCICLKCCFGASFSLPCVLRVSSSFIEDLWLALNWFFSIPAGVLVSWTYTPYKDCEDGEKTKNGQNANKYIQ